MICLINYRIHKDDKPLQGLSSLCTMYAICVIDTLIPQPWLPEALQWYSITILLNTNVPSPILVAASVGCKVVMVYNLITIVREYLYYKDNYNSPRMPSVTVGVDANQIITVRVIEFDKFPL